MIPDDLDNLGKDLRLHPVRSDTSNRRPLATCLQQALLKWTVALLSIHRIVNRRMSWN